MVDLLAIAQTQTDRTVNTMRAKGASDFDIALTLVQSAATYAKELTADTCAERSSKLPTTSLDRSMALDNYDKEPH